MLYIDESGYTGEDILNRDQPIFTIASFLSNEEESRRIVEKYFSNINSEELKFNKIAKSPRYQNYVIDFLRGMHSEAEKIYFSVTHKKYLAVTKMVDAIVEPILYDSGHDLYKKGGNIIMANMLYYLLPEVGGEKLFNNILTSFQRLMRVRTEDSLKNFFACFDDKKLMEQLSDLIVFFKMWPEQYNLEEILTIPPNDLNVAFTNTLFVVASATADLTDKVQVLHDESSNMSQLSGLWEVILGKDHTQTTIGYDRRILKFPLNVKSIDFASSKDFYGLQIADILAGSINYLARAMVTGKEFDEFAGKLFPVIGDNFQIHQIIPTKQFTPKELGTIGMDSVDPHEYLGKIAGEFLRNQ